MSYEIVKNIKIDLKNQKIFITSASNNVYPHTYSEWECKSLEKILQEKGLVEVEKEILLQYENGNFQKSNNKYQLAVDYARILEEYNKKYNWRLLDERNEQELKEFLYKVYKSTQSCKPTIIKFLYHNEQLFVFKIRKHDILPGYGKSDAKIYTNKYRLALDLERLKFKQPAIEFTPIELSEVA